MLNFFKNQSTIALHGEPGTPEELNESPEQETLAGTSLHCPCCGGLTIHRPIKNKLKEYCPVCKIIIK